LQRRPGEIIQRKTAGSNAMENLGNYTETTCGNAIRRPEQTLLA
jgi:hypothetical protein